MPTSVGMTGWHCPCVNHFAGWYNSLQRNNTPAMLLDGSARHLTICVRGDALLTQRRTLAALAGSVVTYSSLSDRHFRWSGRHTPGGHRSDVHVAEHHLPGNHLSALGQPPPHDPHDPAAARNPAR
jgi:hypothetical protein